MLTDKPRRRLDNLNSSRLLFWMSWGAYAAAYIGRLNFSAALASIISEDIFTKSQAGLIGTVFFFCYGGGQLVNGFMADKLSPYKLIFIGLSLSAVANLFMPLSRNFVIMAVVWGINGIAQSMLWAPILYIISNVLHESMRYRACLYIAAAVPLGTLAAYFISMLCSDYSWTRIFTVAGAILGVMAVIWLITSLSLQKHLVPDEVTSSESSGKSSKSTSGIGFGKILIISGLLTIMFAVMLHGMLKEGIMTWVPTMITEIYRVKPSFSIFVSMILPIINLSGAYVATFIFEKLTGYDEVKSGAIIMAFTVIPLSALLFIGKIPLILSVVCLSLITASMHAFNHLFITLAPLRFARFNRTATITGVLNSITYAGCAISNYGFGYLSDIFGWRNSVVSWIVIAVIAFVICFVMIKKWHNFIIINDEEK